MPNVTFSESAINAINEYSRRYREYYEELYSDTGIWGEDQIIDNYIKESVTRRHEIIDLIHMKLQQELILGRQPGETLLLSWRSKTLLILWKDSENERIITKLSIL